MRDGMERATIETERTILRRYTEEDAEALYEIAKDPDVGPHAGWAPHESPAASLEIIRELFLKTDTFAVTDKETGRLIGTTALEPDRLRPDANSWELGYWLARDQWGKGLMTEVAKAMITYGFEDRKLDQIGICTSPVNKRSQNIIKKCGFTYEGTIRRTYKIYDGTLRDSLVFSMLKEEYEEIRRRW